MVQNRLGQVKCPIRRLGLLRFSQDSIFKLEFVLKTTKICFFLQGLILVITITTIALPKHLKTNRDSVLFTNIFLQIGLLKLAHGFSGEAKDLVWQKERNWESALTYHQLNQVNKTCMTTLIILKGYKNAKIRCIFELCIDNLDLFLQVMDDLLTQQLLGQIYLSVYVLPTKYLP